MVFVEADRHRTRPAKTRQYKYFGVDPEKAPFGGGVVESVGRRHPLGVEASDGRQGVSS